MKHTSLFFLSFIGFSFAAASRPCSAWAQEGRTPSGTGGAMIPAGPPTTTAGRPQQLSPGTPRNPTNSPPADSNDTGSGPSEGDDEGSTNSSLQPDQAPSKTNPQRGAQPNAGIQAYTAGSKANTTGPQIQADSFSGYLIPNFGFRYRPDALPRDRWEYGVLGSTVGLIFSGKHFNNRWTYTAHLTFNPLGQSYVSDVVPVDAPPGATAGQSSSGGAGFVVYKTTGPALGIQEISLTYQPTDYLAIRGGYMFIPFTAQSRNPNTALLFSTRATANEVFVSGADRGVLAIAGTKDEFLQASLGVFNGTSLGLTPEQVIFGSRGFVYSFRADVSPFGPFPFAEGDPQRGEFRFGAGFGALYRPATVFEGAGFESVSVRDFRFSASLRMAYRGFFFSAEYLRRQETDNLTNRPKTATGAYVQASVFRPINPGFALGPIGRLGLTVEDQNFLPRTTGYIELGMSFYPYADMPDPNMFKVIVNYQGENRITENEYAHGVNASFQLKF